MSAIAFEGVTKDFGSVTAVDDLSLAIESGTVFGLIGPNGSGKSTVLNLLLDFIRPTDGRVDVLGYDAHEESLAVRERTGVVPDGYAVYDRLTARQHLDFVSASKGGTGDVEAALGRVGLTSAADRPAGDYSSGMKKRLLLGMALVGDPELLVLDEPFRGLDPDAVVMLRETLEEEADRGTTVLLASHLFGQLEVVCDRVGLLLDGRLVAEDDVAAIRAGADEAELHLVVSDADEAASLVRDLDGVTGVRVGDGSLEVRCSGGAAAAVLAALGTSDVAVHDVVPREAPIEALYLAHASDRA